MNSNNRELTKDEAKATLLSERIASLENDNAGLRVELMAHSQEVERLNEKIKEMSGEEAKSPGDED